MAVGLSETEANAIISQNTTDKVVVACINSPTNVTLAGDIASLDDLEKLLRSRGVFSQRLRVDVAYHSDHMQTMATNYKTAISQVVPSLAFPDRTMFSAVTGQEIQPDDLASTYWVENLVSRVKFSDAVINLMKSFPAREKVFVEIGPHQTMQAPLKQIFASCSSTPPPEYVSILNRGRDSATTAYSAAGQLYALGVPVNVSKMNETGRRPKLVVDLPPYSWRHDVAYNAIELAVEQQSCKPKETDRQPHRICFSLNWKPAPEVLLETANNPQEFTLVLPRRPTQTLRALVGVITQRLRFSGAGVNSAVWPAISQEGHHRRFISLVELEGPLFDNASAQDISALQKLASSANSMLWTSLNTAAGSIVPALAQTIRNETPGLHFRSLQVALPYSSRIAGLGTTIAQLAVSNSQDMEFRESQGTLTVPRIKEDAALDDILGRFLPAAPQEAGYRLQSDATYVLAGGLGGLGRNIATFLVDLGARHICFLSRSSTASQDTETFLDYLRKRQVSVSAYKCDISDMRSLRGTLQQCRQEHPPIKGIIQCAMVLRDVSFQRATHQQWQETLRPKVQGSMNLATAAIEPRYQPFFIMLSSFTAIFGNRTQGSYVAACAYQDALAHDLCARGLHAVSLDLGIMRDVGYLAQNGSIGSLKDWEQDFGLREYEMRALLHAAMAKQTPTQPITGLPTAVAAATAGLARPFFLDNPKFEALASTNQADPKTKEPVTAVARPTPPALSNLDPSAPDARDQITTAFRTAIAAALHMSVADVNPTRALHSLGADSLTVIEVQSWLFRSLGVQLSADELMADIPLSRIMDSVWEKWRGGDSG